MFPHLDPFTAGLPLKGQPVEKAVDVGALFQGVATVAAELAASAPPVVAPVAAPGAEGAECQ